MIYPGILVSPVLTRLLEKLAHERKEREVHMVKRDPADHSFRTGSSVEMCWQRSSASEKASAGFVFLAKDMLVQSLLPIRKSK